MKLFGINLSLDKKDSTAVEIRDISVSTLGTSKEIIETKPIGEVKKVHSPALVFQHNGGRATKPTQRREIFEPSEYDLYEIGRIEDVDSYVRQGFKKKVGLFLKEGFDYIGPNKKIVRYIKTRFAQMEQATGIPHQDFIRRLASQFVRKSNAFLVKVRSETASGGKVRVDASGKKIIPIAGYFLVPPETMQIKSDGSGEPFKWRQMLPNGAWIEFEAKDVVHFTFDKKEGFLFGTPSIVPVIDDIRALRTIEENLELLVYKHLFPLFHFKVGTEKMPAGITEDGLKEVDVLRQEIQNMPTEGCLVTSERFAIDSVGSESKALRAESYLTHFKNRVFSGLGMSAVDFGEPDTSNKSTADTMSRALVDDIKDYQEAFEAQFNSFVINELLLEANFSEDVFTPENKVEIFFREIDIDKQIKMENHAVDLYAKDGLTWSELRHELGRDPIKIPEDPENVEPGQYKEWLETSWKLFREPAAMISAKHAPYSPFVAALAESPASAVKPSQVAETQTAQQANELAITKAKGAQKKVAKKDNFLENDYFAMEKDVVTECSKISVKTDYVNQKLIHNMALIESKLRSAMNTSFLDGLGQDAVNLIDKVSITRKDINTRAYLVCNRLKQDIRTALSKRIDTGNPNDKIPGIHSVFSAFKYRIDFIVKTEIVRAYNLGLIYQAIKNGIETVKLVSDQNACSKCKNLSNNFHHLEYYQLNTVPPHHPGCNCVLVATKGIQNG